MNQIDRQYVVVPDARRARKTACQVGGRKVPIPKGSDNGNRHSRVEFVVYYCAGDKGGMGDFTAVHEISDITERISPSAGSILSTLLGALPSSRRALLAGGLLIPSKLPGVSGRYCGASQTCYASSLRLASSHPNRVIVMVGYYFLPHIPLPMQHAWVYDTKRRVFRDACQTNPNLSLYVGLPLEPHRLQQFVGDCMEPMDAIASARRAEIEEIERYAKEQRARILMDAAPRATRSLSPSPTAASSRLLRVDDSERKKERACSRSRSKSGSSSAHSTRSLSERSDTGNCSSSYSSSHGKKQ